jgi:hypothetical protein
MVMVQLQQFRKPLNLLVVICFSISLQSCYHYRILTTAPDPATEYQKMVLWSYAWGLYNKPKDFTVKNCVDSTGIDELRVTNSVGSVFLTIVTLGIVSPVTVEWKCHKPRQRSGQL